MSTNWSGYRGKRLDFSFFKGGGKTEYLVAGVLGLVIIIAIYMVVKQFFGGDIGDVPDKLVFKCEKCQAEFTKKLSELPQARNPAEQVNSMLLDCPSCKAQKSCWQTMKCPNCKKNFIADSMRASYARLRSGGRGGPAQDPPDVCPYCKTNVNDWYAKHNK